MNILIFSWRDPKHPLAGGAEQVIHEHAKGWIRMGHTVTLFSSKFPKSKKKEMIDGVKIFRGGYQYLGVQVAAFFFYFKKRGEYDFVIDCFHGLPFFTPLYVRKPKIAVIQETAREVWFLNPLPPPLNWAVGLLGYLVEPIIFKLYKSTQFVTGSKSAKKDVSNMGIPKNKITVWPHGVIVLKPKPLLEKEKVPTIVYLGVLSKDKGIEDAIKCFKILSEMGNYKFWIIGKPETKNYLQTIKRIIREKNIKVKLFGFVSQKKKFELLAKAHILINPSVREGWGLVNIEANAMGTPVVSYNNVGLVDSVKNGISGIICNENSPESLVENVDRVIKDSKLYDKLSKSAISWSKKFNWKNSVKLSFALISRIHSNA